MNDNFKPLITIFHCIKAFSNGIDYFTARNNAEIRNIQLPCSSAVKDIYLLRAYEAGSDAVVILTCPEGQCRYVDGNIRAKKRVRRVQTLLDEIGLGAQRLSLYNISTNDEVEINQIINKTVSDLLNIGPNPVA